MYLVAGVSGHTGRAAAESLLKNGKPVMVLVRSAEKGDAWKAKGAAVAVASLDDENALAAALEGKQGAYFLIPPNYAVTDFIAESRKVSGSIAKAVQKSKIPHVVLLSSAGAHHTSGTGPIITLHDAETALRAAAANLTVLRPSIFLEESGSMLGVAAETGALPSFLTPGRKLPMNATRDIGSIAAESLMTPAKGVRVVNISGPEDYAPEDLAAAMGTVLKKEVALHSLPPQAAVGALTAQGLHEGTAKLIAELYEGMNSGWIFYNDEGELRRGKVTPVEVFREMASQ